jgi:hypothetical protein
MSAPTSGLGGYSGNVAIGTNSTLASSDIEALLTALRSEDNI